MFYDSSCSSKHKDHMLPFRATFSSFDARGEKNDMEFLSLVRRRDENKKTAYVIGTGPSLKGVDMSKLKNEDTITFNRAYVAFDDWGFHPTYYLSIDSQDLESISEDIVGLMDQGKIEKYFLPHDSHFYHLANSNQYRDKITLLQDTPESWKMALSFNECIALGKTNTLITPILASAGYMGAKMLYLMGYNEVVLLGCDAYYRTDEESQRSVIWDEDGCVSQEDYDPNHFRDDYFGKGQRFGRPTSTEEQIQWWNTAAINVDLHKRFDSKEDFNIFSCSEGSKLNSVFPYIPFEEFMLGRRRPQNIPLER